MLGSEATHWDSHEDVKYVQVRLGGQRVVPCRFVKQGSRGDHWERTYSTTKQRRSQTSTDSPVTHQVNMSSFIVSQSHTFTSLNIWLPPFTTLPAPSGSLGTGACAHEDWGRQDWGCFSVPVHVHKIMQRETQSYLSPIWALWNHFRWMCSYSAHIVGCFWIFPHLFWGESCELLRHISVEVTYWRKVVNLLWGQSISSSCSLDWP